MRSVFRTQSLAPPRSHRRSTHAGLDSRSQRLGAAILYLAPSDKKHVAKENIALFESASAARDDARTNEALVAITELVGEDAIRQLLPMVGFV